MNGNNDSNEFMEHEKYKGEMIGDGNINNKSDANFEARTYVRSQKNSRRRE